MPRFSIEHAPNDVAIRANRVAGIRKELITGHSEGVDTTFKVVHAKSGDGDLDVAGLNTTPAQIKISSSNANDADGGTGARTVRVRGLDENILLVDETVTLNGQTAVTTTTTFKCVTGLRVLTAGSTGHNEGDLYAGSGTVTAGVPATPYMTMEATKNDSAASVFAVAKDERFVMTQLFASIGDTSKTLEFELDVYDPSTGLWYERMDIHTKAAEFYLPIEAFESFEAGAIILTKAKIDVGTATLSVLMSGAIVETV